MSNQDFPRPSRLLTSREFTAVFTNTKLKIQSPSFLVLAINSVVDHPRLGCIVAKKNARHAVQRNRIKRIIRETFRLNRNHLFGLDLVVLAKNKAVELNNNQLHQELGSLWKKPLLRKSE